MPGQFPCRDILEPDAELRAPPVQIAAVIHLEAACVFARAQHGDIAAQRDLVVPAFQQGLPAIGGPGPPAARILVAQAEVVGLDPRQRGQDRPVEHRRELRRERGLLRRVPVAPVAALEGHRQRAIRPPPQDHPSAIQPDPRQRQAARQKRRARQRQVERPEIGEPRAGRVKERDPLERHLRCHPVIEPERQRIKTQPVIGQHRAELLLRPLAQPARCRDPRRQHRDEADAEGQHHHRAAKADLPDMMQQATPRRHARGRLGPTWT